MASTEESVPLRRGMAKVNYAWLIPNFSDRHEANKQAVESPEFFCERTPNIRWRLLVYPRGDRTRAQDYVCVHLQLVSAGEMTEIVAKLKISILSSQSDDETGDIICCSDMTRFSTCSAWGYDVIPYTMIHRRLLESSPWLPRDTLTIQCSLELIFETLPLEPRDVLSSDDCDDLASLFESLMISDVIFCVEGREFPAHKNILSSQSPFFAAIFGSEADRKSRTRIQISGVSHQVFYAALRYVYNGEADNMQRLAPLLLPVAKTYGFDALFETCQQLLSTQLTNENWIHFLSLANLHSAHELKKSIIDYVHRFDNPVINPDKWNDLLSAHPALVGEILHAPQRI